MRTVQWLCIVFGLVQLPFVLFSQGESIRLDAIPSTKEVVEGGHLEVSYQLLGSINGDFRAPGFGAFTRSGTTQELSGMQFINGTVSAHHTWVIGLTAPSPGEYTIPPAEVYLKGKTYRSKALQIRVLPAAKASVGAVASVPPGADPSLFLSAEVTRSNVYVGQQVVIKVYLYTKRTLSGVNLVRLPQLSKGTLKELERYNEPDDQVMLRGEQYNRLLVYAGSFFAESSGSVVISPAIVNTAVISGNIFQSFRTVQLAASPLSIEVKELPAPIPEGFSGLIGQYEAEVGSLSDSILEGDASVCTLMIRGNGNSRLLVLPPTVLSEGLTGYDPIVKEEEVYENGQEIAHRQVLEYTISAQSEGNQTVKPVFIWFDPDSSRYCTYSPLVPIFVGKGQRNTFLSTDDGSNSYWNRSRRIGVGALLAALFLLIGYFLFSRYRRGQLTDLGSKPKEVVLSELTVDAMTVPTQTEGALLESYSGIYWEVKRFFAKKIGVTPEEIGIQRLCNWLEANGYSSAAITDMRTVFSTCEQALYAEQDHGQDYAVIKEKAIRLLQGVPY